MERRNLIVVGTGTIGTGKSKLLADRYVRRAPRVIHIDENDEICDAHAGAHIPGAVRAVGAGKLFDYLAIAAREGVTRFNVAAVGLEPGEICELFTVLAPRAGTGDSLSRAFGGLAIECGEMGALCAANRSISDTVANTVMRSRHSVLSLFFATQYPYSLPPVIRGNVHEVFSFQQSEPRALDWVKETMGAAASDAVRGLRDHSFVLYIRASGSLYVCDKYRRITRTLTAATQLAEGAGGR